MTARTIAGRTWAVLLLLLLGVGGAGLRWMIDLKPRALALQLRGDALQADRRRLAETRAQLLRLGSDGIAARNAELRAEVERREALAPAGGAESSAMEVRERFASLAKRYGVHAPTFEQMPEQVEGGLRIGRLRVRAAGGYDVLGTWITESISDQRLIDVDYARLEVVPDSLTRTVRASAGETGVVQTLPSPAAVPGPPALGAIVVAGAVPLDAVTEFVVRWYALEELPASSAGAK